MNARSSILVGLIVSVPIAGATLAGASETKTVATLAEFERTLDLVARDERASAEVIDITCDDSDEDVKFCATDFADVCTAHGGGLSTNPDGTITCSVVTPKKTAPDGLKTAEVSDERGFNRALDLKASDPNTSALVLTCSPGDSAWCSEGGFLKACDDAGGGMSTNPDGSVSCSVP